MSLFMHTAFCQKGGGNIIIKLNDASMQMFTNIFTAYKSLGYVFQLNGYTLRERYG